MGGTYTIPTGQLAGRLRRTRAARLRILSGRQSVKGRHMARALLGYLPTSSDRYLAEEVARLKGRVRALEAELAELRASQESEQLLDELHRITSSASALA